MAKRSTIRLELAFGAEATGEGRSARAGGAEAGAAGAARESAAAMAGPCMEAIVERDNLKEALARVKRNKARRHDRRGLERASERALADDLRSAA